MVFGGEMFMRGPSQFTVLCRWLQNELDVVETYKLALHKLQGLDDVATARQSMLEHANCALEVHKRLRAIGHDPALVESSAVPHRCTKERLAIAAMTRDEAIVDALLDNERGRLDAYESALRRADVGALVRRLLTLSLDAQKARVSRLSARAAAHHSSHRRAA